ncbi:hypothetical protein PG994_002151 [Apiospora phragmitis]|uniref:DUF6604 domain-containing protein n=1 Tax=Apiospora phragmitis TaxID=2905665 RepID=A0ABR1WVM9_9PEZI
MDAEISPPEELLITYKQYKADTGFIAGWLVANATNCGYKLANAAAPPGRLKGKARKEARKQGPKYTIKVSEFVGAARAIANFTPRPRIPQALGRLFDRAIAARRACTEWYEQHRHGDSLSNERHTNFTNTLIDAWETLRPFQTLDKKRTDRRAKPSAKDLKNDGGMSFLNRFSKLHVQDATSSDPDAANNKSAQAETIADVRHEPDAFKLPDVSPATIEKDEEDIEDDFFFAIQSFLGDLERLRDNVKAIWSAYACGKSELTLASLLTNTTIQLARRAEGALDLTIERPKKYPASEFPTWTLPALLMYVQHERDDSRLQKMSAFEFVSLSTKTFGFSCEHASFYLWSVYDAVKQMVAYSDQSLKGQKIHRNEYAVAVPPYDGLYTNGESENETYRRVRELLPGFQITAIEFVNSFANDEITRGVFEMFKSSTLPIWAVFGIHLLLDMQDILGVTSSAQPLEELQSHTHNMPEVTDFETYPFGTTADNHKSIMTWTSIRQREFKKIVLEDDIRQRVSQVPVPEAVKSKFMKMDCIQEENWFLRRHPLRCGLLKYHLYFLFHCAGIRFGESSWGLSALIHVYAACRRLYPDDPVWPDMELYLVNQDLDYLFFGGIPRTMAEAFTKASLAFGISPTYFARNRRGSALPPYSRSNIRVALNPSHMLNVWTDWALAERRWAALTTRCGD